MEATLPLDTVPVFPTLHLHPSRRLTARGRDRPALGKRAGGFTLIETAVAAVLITLFLSSLFLLNSMVLRMLRAGNETATASQVLQARAEQIRMANWLNVTDPAYLPNTVLPQVPATAINLSTLTETISVGPYQFNAATQPAPSFIFQRAPDGTITSQGGTGAALVGNDCLQFTITESWISWGGRPRVRSLTTLASTWGIGQQ